jgi:hypothetical protein
LKVQQREVCVPYRRYILHTRFNLIHLTLNLYHTHYRHFFKYWETNVTWCKNITYTKINGLTITRSMLHPAESMSNPLMACGCAKMLISRCRSRIFKEYNSQQARLYSDSKPIVSAKVGIPSNLSTL